jgi:hypothetical protein
MDGASSKPAGLLATTIAVSIHRAGANPIYGEGAVILRLDDEVAGPFFVIESCGGDVEQKPGEIRIDPAELAMVAAQAEKLLAGWPVGEESQNQS